MWRNFFESRASAPVLAHAPLACIRQLDTVEHAAGELSAERRRALRQKESVPMLTSFEDRLGIQGRLASSRSPIGWAATNPDVGVETLT